MPLRAFLMLSLSKAARRQCQLPVWPQPSAHGDATVYSASPSPASSRLRGRSIGRKRNARPAATSSRRIAPASRLATACPATGSDPAPDLYQAYTDLKEGRYQNAVERFTRAIQSGNLSGESLLRAYDGRASAYEAQELYQLAIAD